ncbi:MAG: TonB-dependent receptor [Proteobacteria bacterium]|nr:TonB-dependent receptor [Pseudomonadota bacterium]
MNQRFCREPAPAGVAGPRFVSSPRVQGLAAGTLIAAVAGVAVAADAAVPASGADAAATQSPETVVVTATRVATPQQEIASSLTVVTAEEIEARQLRTVADVLKAVPGVNVVQTGGPGGTTSVFMRGTNSNHTKMLIDGIDVGDPSNSTGAFDYGQLLTQDIERVEVLRGPQSGLYGSDAIGGVINIITRRGAGPAQFTGYLEGGSFATFNQAAGISGSADAFHYSADVSHFHAGSTPVTPLPLLQPGEARNNDHDDNLSASTRLGYDLTPTLDLGLVARYSDIDLRTTGDSFDPVTFASFPAPQQTQARTHSYFGRLFAHLNSFDGLLDQTFGVADSHERTETVDPQNGLARNTGERRKADWQGNLHLQPGETLVLGAEYQRDQIKDPLYASDRIASGYVELQSHVLQWSSAVNLRYDEHNRFGSKVTYRFAPAYQIEASGTVLKASIGSGFKAPTLSQLYQDFPQYFFYANPNLKPETSTGWDAGFEQPLTPAVRVGAVWYHNRIHDLITAQFDPVTFNTTYANVGRATTEGLESFVTWQALDALALRVDYTYTQATDDLRNKELLRRPRHKGTVDATWNVTAAVRLSADLLWVGGWVDISRDGSIPDLAAPGYTTVNLAASWDASAHWTLFGRIDNLLDRRYQNPTGFLQPGFGVFAGVKTRW